MTTDYVEMGDRLGVIEGIRGHGPRQEVDVAWTHERTGNFVIPWRRAAKVTRELVLRSSLNQTLLPPEPFAELGDGTELLWRPATRWDGRWVKVRGEWLVSILPESGESDEPRPGHGVRATGRKGRPADLVIIDRVVLRQRHEARWRYTCAVVDGGRTEAT